MVIVYLLSIHYVETYLTIFINFLLLIGCFKTFSEIMRKLLAWNRIFSRLRLYFCIELSACITNFFRIILCIYFFFLIDFIICFWLFESLRVLFLNASVCSVNSLYWLFLLWKHAWMVASVYWVYIHRINLFTFLQLL